jgi:nitroreductase
VAPEALGALIRQRRSLRVYKKDPVSREVLEAIARHAAFAPTGAHGGEGWVRHVAIVAGEENMRRVVEMTARYMEGMAALLDGFVVRQMARWNVEIRRGRSMLDDLRMRLAERAAGRDAITYDAPAAIFVHTTRSTTTPYEDCHGALMQLLLLAEAHGLGTCWNGWLVKAGSGFKSRSTEFRDFLGLPADHDVYAAATIGYPGVKLHSVPQREVEVRWIGP